MVRWPQFSLITLAGIVVFFAIGCCAWIYASHNWAAVLQTAAIVFLTFAITAAIYREGRPRAFWLGASVWGGVYLLLGFWLFPIQQQVDTLGRITNQPAGPSQLSLWVYEHVLPRLRTPPASASFSGPWLGTGIGSDAGLTGTIVVAPGATGMGSVTSGSLPSYYPDQESFLRVGQALWLWLFIFAGGFSGCWLYSTRSTARSTVGG